MMTRAYSELYLEDAMNNLGEAFDYAANACNMDKDLFMSFFINTDMSYSFERGNPMVIAGMSGTELVQKTLAKCRYRTDFPDPLDMLCSYRGLLVWMDSCLCSVEYRIHIQKDYENHHGEPLHPSLTLSGWSFRLRRRMLPCLIRSIEV